MSPEGRGMTRSTRRRCCTQPTQLLQRNSRRAECSTDSPSFVYPAGPAHRPKPGLDRTARLPSSTRPPSTARKLAATAGAPLPTFPQLGHRLRAPSASAFLIQEVSAVTAIPNLGVHRREEVQMRVSLVGVGRRSVNARESAPHRSGRSPFRTSALSCRCSCVCEQRRCRTARSQLSRVPVHYPPRGGNDAFHE